MRTKPKADAKLQLLLAAAFDHFQRMDDPNSHARCRRNFVFHMTDWSEDLLKLADLYRSPDKYDKTSAAEIISAFVNHVIPHLRAAGRLMLDYDPEDIFKEIDYTSG